jgi:hypothetical protein
MNISESLRLKVRKMFDLIYFMDKEFAKITERKFKENRKISLLKLEKRPENRKLQGNLKNPNLRKCTLQRYKTPSNKYESLC